jgi:guanylate kinase
MERSEIKERIDELLDEVKAAISVNTFVLNTDVEEKMKEIKELQDSCSHQFVDGCCTFCYKKEDD